MDTISIVQEPSTQPPLLQPGTKLGKYELMQRIAVGGMAELHLARIRADIGDFEKLVVLKRILPQFAESEEFTTMFLNEARLVASFQHANIAQVYDIGEADGSYFFTMEFVHGRNLYQLRKRTKKLGKPIPIDFAVAVIIDAAAGLHCAHEHRGPDGDLLGVVHCDVSPANIIVGFDGCTKMVDFGIALAKKGRLATNTASLKGKVGYMSPEQCEGKALDRRSDVFCLANVLYEATTGLRPFEADSDLGLIKAIAKDKPIKPSERMMGYPPALEAVIMKALSNNPDDRHSTAQEFQLALEDFATYSRMSTSAVGVAQAMERFYGKELADWRPSHKGDIGIEEHIAKALVRTPSPNTKPQKSVAKPEADAAESKADAAESKADAAESKADAAESKADAAESKADKSASKAGAKAATLKPPPLPKLAKSKVAGKPATDLGIVRPDAAVTPEPFPKLPAKPPVPGSAEAKDAWKAPVAKKADAKKADAKKADAKKTDAKKTDAKKTDAKKADAKKADAKKADAKKADAKKADNKDTANKDNEGNEGNIKVAKRAITAEPNFDTKSTVGRITIKKARPSEIIAAKAAAKREVDKKHQMARRAVDEAAERAAATRKRKATNAESSIVVSDDAGKPNKAPAPDSADDSLVISITDRKLTFVDVAELEKELRGSSGSGVLGKLLAVAALVAACVGGYYMFLKKPAPAETTPVVTPEPAPLPSWAKDPADDKKAPFVLDTEPVYEGGADAVSGSGIPHGDLLTTEPAGEQTADTPQKDPIVQAQPDNKQPDNKQPDNKRPDHKRPGHKRPGNKRPGNKRPGNKRPKDTASAENSSKDPDKKPKDPKKDSNENKDPVKPWDHKSALLPD